MMVHHMSIMVIMTLNNILTRHCHDGLEPGLDGTEGNLIRWIPAFAGMTKKANSPFPVTPAKAGVHLIDIDI